MITQDNITLGQRVVAPTPKFFNIIRWISFGLGALGGIVATGGAIIPALVPVAGYLATAGTVAGVVASLPVDFEKLKQQGK